VEVTYFVDETGEELVAIQREPFELADQQVGNGINRPDVDPGGCGFIAVDVDSEFVGNRVVDTRQMDPGVERNRIAGVHLRGRTIELINNEVSSSPKLSSAAGQVPTIIHVTIGLVHDGIRLEAIRA